VGHPRLAKTGKLNHSRMPKFIAPLLSCHGIGSQTLVKVRSLMAVYLVTGGCGFIGSHLCEALRARGGSVRILDDLSTGLADNAPPGSELVRGSVSDPDIVDEALTG